MRGEPSRKELTVALVAALSWLAVVLIRNWHWRSHQYAMLNEVMQALVWHLGIEGSISIANVRNLMPTRKLR